MNCNRTYLDGCKTSGEKQYPARFPAELPEFFINMLTQRGDLVLDIFAGSNTTGQAAENRGAAVAGLRTIPRVCRQIGRSILDKRNGHAERREIFHRIEAGDTVDLNDYIVQTCCR